MKDYYLFKKKFNKNPFIIKYIANFFYFVDAGINCIVFCGDPTVTLSQRLGYVKKNKKKLFGKIKIYPILKSIDKIFNNHFEKSYDKFGDRPWKWCESSKIFK